jgi:hypothetical protein
MRIVLAAGCLLYTALLVVNVGTLDLFRFVFSMGRRRGRSTIRSISNIITEQPER